MNKILSAVFLILFLTAGFFILPKGVKSTILPFSQVVVG
jgi:hypothetical protein